jgi:lipopolysaccharide/colanic/teichoic acid biosynthesis glycosyltransferase
LTYSIASDIQKYDSNRTIASSRSIYNLVQTRRAAARWAAYHNKTHRIHNTYAPQSKTTNSNSNQNRFLIERLRIVIIFSSIPLVFMIVIVITCIFVRYIRGKNPIFTERVEQINGTRFSEIIYDTRDFSRKTRILPTAV